MRCGVIAAFVIILFLSACSSKQCLFCKSNAEVHLRTENEARVYLEAVIAGVERKATYPCKRPLELALDSGVWIARCHPDIGRHRGGGFTLKIESEGGRVYDWIFGQ